MHTPTFEPPAPGPDCARLAPLLPLLQAGELEADEAVALRAHTSECRWCQAQLAGYDTADAALRRHVTAVAVTAPDLSVEAIMRLAEHEAPSRPQNRFTARPGQWQHPRQSRRFLSGLAAVAAVLAIAGLAMTAFLAAPHHMLGRAPVEVPTPDLAHLTVYAFYAGQVGKLRASDGAQRSVPQGWPYSSSDAPTIENGIAYLAPYKSPVLAVRLSDGAVIWQSQAVSGRAILSRVSLMDGTAYLATGDAPGESTIYQQGNALYALRASDGAVRWRYGVTAPVTSPVVGDGEIFADVGDATIALRADDGAPLWRTPLRVNGYPYIGMWLAETNGVVYVHAYGQYPGQPLIPNVDSTYAFALRASDGAVLWRYALGRDDSLSPNVPILAGGSVYFRSVSRFPPTPTAYLYALRARDGTLLWRFQDTGEPGPDVRRPFVDIADPLVANDNVYAIDNTGVVSALRASDGTPLWRQHIDGTDRYSAPVLADGVIFIIRGWFVVALRASDGVLLWRRLGASPPMGGDDVDSGPREGLHIYVGP
jgi:outer membrane protein assembly factor BamB